VDPQCTHDLLIGICRGKWQTLTLPLAQNSAISTFQPFGIILSSAAIGSGEMASAELKGNSCEAIKPSTTADIN